MSTIGTVPTGTDNYRSISGLQSLSSFSEQRSVSLDTTKAFEQRERMSQTINHGEERNLIDATKDLANNLFSAFRNELRDALAHIGITGEKAADLVRDIGKSFIEAVREGSNFSFGMIAAAYKETITQTATSMSHALEFSANALMIEYNHATGELTADTSKMEIDAVKMFSSDNLPAADTQALFDFTDGEGAPGIGQLFDRVRQYLEQYGFIDEAGEDGDAAAALPEVDEAAYDMLLVNNEEVAAGDDEADTDTAGENPAAAAQAIADAGGLDALKVRAIETFTNARGETVTRMTLDFIVRAYLDKDDTQPEVFQAEHRTNESFQITA